MRAGSVVVTRRRFAIAFALAVPITVGVCVAAANLWLPGWVRSRAEQVIAKRLGLPTTIGAVDLGVASLELSDVRVGDEEGAQPLLIAIDRVSVQLALTTLLTEGPSSIRALHVGAVRVTFRQGHHLLPAWWKHVRGATRDTDVPEGDKARVMPDLQVDRVSVQVTDRAGLLVAAEAEHVSVVRDVMSAQVNSLRLGGVPGTVVTLKDVEISGERVEGVLGLREMHVGDAVVQLPPADGPDLRDRLMALVPTRESVGRADGDAETRPAAAAEGAAAEPQAKSHQTLQAILRRLSEGSLIAVERANVSRGGESLVRDLKGRVQMAQSDELLLEGTGHTAGDGLLDWKLRVWPRQLRGEGSVDLERLPFALLAPLLPDLPWHEADRTTVDAQLVLQGDSSARIGWSGRMTLAGLALYSPKLAPEPVVVPLFALEGRGFANTTDHRLEITEARVSIGDVSASLEGSLERDAEHTLVDLTAKLPRAACEDILHAIPRTLLGEVANFHLAGFASGSLRVKIDSRALSSTELDFGLEDGCTFVEVPTLADLRRFTGPFVHYAVEPDETVFEMETGPGTEHWTPIEDISPLFVHAVLAHEDTQFFLHNGFSLQHIRGALVRNLEAGRYVLGASTISMQLVKNLLLRREKTLARKAQEVVLTWWVERTLDKHEILELYLNVIEYGPAVYGIRRASQYYFSRDPSELSPAESVFLSTILPNPKAYHSFFEKNALSSGWTDRMRNQIQRMQARGWYAKETAQFGINELAAFRFFPEGSVRMPTPTPMPTATSPLPYQPGAPLSDRLPTLDQLNFATIDGGD